jgi:hypothetical protein
LKNQVIFPATELAIAQKFEEPGHLSPQKPPAVFRPSRALFLPGSSPRNPAPGHGQIETTTRTLKGACSSFNMTVDNAERN